MKELKLAWRYVRRHWWQYILGILALFIVDEVNTYVPRFTGEITNGLDQHTLDMGGVMGLVWKIVLIGVIIAVGRFAWRFFLFGSARSIEKELRSDLFAHLSTLSPHYYNEHKTGDLIARLINDMLAGLDKDDMQKTISITDRREAIKTACMLAQPGDVILVAGKGHENYQEIKGVKHHFDDKEILNEIMC